MVITAVLDKYILLFDRLSSQALKLFCSWYLNLYCLGGEISFQWTISLDSQLDEEKLLELFSKVKLMKVDSDSPTTRTRLLLGLSPMQKFM